MQNVNIHRFREDFSSIGQDIEYDSRKGKIHLYHMNVFHLRYSGDGADFNIFISISILSLYDFRMGFKYDYLILY